MKALILVDIQNDFLPGGALAVPHGDEILPAVNKLLKLPFDLVVATKDWHPVDHGSFADIYKMKPGDHVLLAGIDQILWPRHCVHDTKGAEFAPGWDSKKVDQVIHKGTDSQIDSYSTFFDNGLLKSTGLEDYLKEKGVREIIIAGLATDYCVKYSVLDAIDLGFDVTVIPEACRGVNLSPQDSEEALNEMEAAGAKLMTIEALKDTFQKTD